MVTTQAAVVEAEKVIVLLIKVKAAQAEAVVQV
jgi:hypothetical protein